MSNSLGDLRICVERPLRSEENAIKIMNEQSHSDSHYDRLQAAFQTSKLWPKNVKEIKIQFVNSTNYSVAGQRYSNPEKPQWTPKQILEGAVDNKGNSLPIDPLEEKLYGQSDLASVVKTIYTERIQPIIPFKLSFVESQGDVRISFVGGAGSWSLVGTDCLRCPPDNATLNYGWIDVPTVIHEFCHVLGMIHEHENPRGNPIEWNEPKVYQWAQSTQGWDKETTYNNIIMRYSNDQVNGSDYDPLSVMLYFFPASLTLNNIGTQQNMRLSPIDVQWIEKQYPGGAVSPSKFYLEVYGENIGDTTGGFFSGGTSTFFLTTTKSKFYLIFVVIAIFIIAFLVWYFISKKKRRKSRRK
jgi:hypothetical protein